MCLRVYVSLIDFLARAAVAVEMSTLMFVADAGLFV